MRLLAAPHELHRTLSVLQHLQYHFTSYAVLSFFWWLGSVHLLHLCLFLHLALWPLCFKCHGIFENITHFWNIWMWRAHKFLCQVNQTEGGGGGGGRVFGWEVLGGGGGFSNFEQLWATLSNFAHTFDFLYGRTVPLSMTKCSQKHDIFKVSNAFPAIKGLKSLNIFWTQISKYILDSNL